MIIIHAMNDFTMKAKPLFQFLVFVAGMAALLFFAAGSVRWLGGWLYLAVLAGAGASVTFGVFKRYPELQCERRTAAKSAKPWDRVLVPLMTGIPFVGTVLAAVGHRFGWSAPFPSWTVWPAAAAMASGAALTYWGMISNPFFSSHVRIQSDRGHHVIAVGPYAQLRHPGYAGAIAFTLAAPVALNSGIAGALAIVTVLLTVVRTALEDRTLKRELPGYADYAARVRCRLVPFVW